MPSVIPLKVLLQEDETLNSLGVVVCRERDGAGQA